VRLQLPKTASWRVMACTAPEATIELAGVTHVVLSGGGIRGLCYLGMLKAIEDALRARGSSYAHFVDGLEVCVGTSIGALVALLLALELPVAALHFVQRPDGTVASDMLPEMCGDVFRQRALDDGESLVHMAQTLLRQRHFSTSITLKELHRCTGKRLVCVATDVGRLVAVYLDANTAPTMAVADAVAASMRVPLLYAPHEVGDRVLADGCLMDNFPLSACAGVDPARVLALRTRPCERRTATRASARMYVCRCIMCPQVALEAAQLGLQSEQMRARVVTAPTGAVLGPEFDADRGTCAALWWSGVYTIYRRVDPVRGTAVMAVVHLLWGVVGLMTILRERRCVEHAVRRMRRAAERVQPVK